MATCPDREAHSEALKDLVNQVITAELSGEEEDAGLAMFGSMIGTGLSGLVIDNMLNVEDYLVCSIGTAYRFNSPACLPGSRTPSSSSSLRLTSIPPP